MYSPDKDQYVAAKIWHLYLVILNEQNGVIPDSGGQTGCTFVYSF